MPRTIVGALTSIRTVLGLSVPPQIQKRYSELIDQNFPSSLRPIRNANLEKLCTRMTCYLDDASIGDVDHCRDGLFPDPGDNRCCSRYRLPSGSKIGQGPFESSEGLQGSGRVECHCSLHAHARRPAAGAIT